LPKKNPAKDHSFNFIFIYPFLEVILKRWRHDQNTQARLELILRINHYSRREADLSLKIADPKYYEALNWIKERVSSKPKVGVVCGSGLGKFADTLEEVTSFNYKDIPHFPVSTVEGHKVNILVRFTYYRRKCLSQVC